MEKKMEKITVTYSGWCEIDAEDVVFINIQDDSPNITGKEWLKLSLEERGNYILENVNDVIQNSTDGEWTEIDIEESE
jgi:hypothetical protein